MRETTKVAVKAALALGALGFLVSRFYVIRFANTQSAIALIALWYVIFFAFINLTVYWIWREWDFRTLRASLGVLLLWFAALVAFYWPASRYTVLISGANPANVPTPLIATEDDLVFEGWYALLGNSSLASVGPYLAGLGLALVLFFAFVMWQTFTKRRIATRGFRLFVTLLLFVGLALLFIGLGGVFLGTLWVEGALTYGFTPIVLVLLAAAVLTPHAFATALRRILHVGAG